MATSSVATCNDGTQPPNWCPTTGREMMPSVLGLLPPGPAWEGMKTPGLAGYKFWSVYADVLAFVYALLCAYVLEFFCSTATQSVDQWAVDFDLYDPCDSYGQNLCAKVTELGAQDRDYFVMALHRAGWVVTVEDFRHHRQPMPGMFEVGCTGLGPAPVRSGPVYNDGITCYDYGSVYQHPFPQFWEHSHTYLSTSCPVPGSGLGLGPGTIEDIDCFIVGYYEIPTIGTTAVEPDTDGGCADFIEVIYFGCNNQVFPQQRAEPSDLTGKWRIGYGNMYTWVVTVDEAASYALQGLPIPDNTLPDCQAGNFVPGCSMLCPCPPDDARCVIEKIAPAHAELVIQYA